MTAEEKADSKILKDNVEEMKDSLQLLKRAIMGDLKDNSKGILENIRNLQEEHEENKKKIDLLTHKSELWEQNINTLKETSDEIKKIRKELETLSRYKWMIWALLIFGGYIMSHITQFLAFFKALVFGIK